MSGADNERLEVYADNLGIEPAPWPGSTPGTGILIRRPCGCDSRGVGPDDRHVPSVPGSSGHHGGRRGIRRPASDLPRPPVRRRAAPVVVSGPEPGSDGNMQRTYELTSPVTMLGRGTDCDLRLVDPGVSRHHAELRVEDDQVVLVDLGSTNGTFVNSEPVRRIALTDGTQGHARAYDPGVPARRRLLSPCTNN